MDDRIQDVFQCDNCKSLLVGFTNCLPCTRFLSKIKGKYSPESKTFRDDLRARAVEGTTSDKFWEIVW